MAAYRVNPPFRVEHVGSFLRPEWLMDEVRRFRASEIDAKALAAAQDRAVIEIVRFQERIGLRSITDGEFRRRGWSAGFIDAIPNFGYREGALGSFKTESGEVITVAQSPYAKGRLKRERGIATGEFAYLNSVVTSGVPKITMPSPSVMHFFLGPRSVDEKIYPDIDVFFSDLIEIYSEEIADLAKLGCRYLQLDDTALPCLCDPSVREEIKRRGEDPEKLLWTYVGLINKAISQRPSNMTIGIHLCRGNLKGAWMAEGGYDFIAETLFNAIEADAYFLEYDTVRAGDFTPLRYVPSNKTIVLGLLSTKTAQLESAGMLKSRIEEAARYVSVDQLCLSPQCGFSSAPGGGQVLTSDDTARKIGLMQRIANDVWGDN